MIKIPLHWKIIIGMILGIVWAIASVRLGWSDFTQDWINPWGIIFLRLLKFVAVPLVLFSVMKGMCDLKDIGTLGRMGVKTLAIYLTTTVLAVTIGLLLVNIFKPGRAIREQDRIANHISYELWLKQNPGVEAADNIRYGDKAESTLLEQAREKLVDESGNETVKDKEAYREKAKAKSPLQFLVDTVPENIFMSLSANRMLQIIFFAVFFGIVLVLIDPLKAAPVVSLIDGINQVFLKMVDIIMKAAPIFVFALMAGKLSELAGDDISKLGDLFAGLGGYSLLVVAGLLFVAFGIYPLLFAVARRNKQMPFTAALKTFFRGMAPAQLLAFSTSSSAATLPVTMECVKDNLNVPEQVGYFVLPIGATVNMDGTSLYQAVAVIFLAQMHNIELDLAHQCIIILTATLASIGSAAVPGAGLIMLMVVLQSVGLNPAWIAIILPVDRILDMCRTVVNVSGDAVVSTVVTALEKKVDFGE